MKRENGPKSAIKPPTRKQLLKDIENLNNDLRLARLNYDVVMRAFDLKSIYECNMLQDMIVKYLEKVDCIASEENKEKMYANFITALKNVQIEKIQCDFGTFWSGLTYKQSGCDTIKITFRVNRIRN